MSLYWNCASWSHLQYCRLIWNTWAKMFPRMLWCCDVVIELPKGMNIFVTQTVLLASSEVWNDSLQCRSQLRCNWDVKPCPLFSAEQVVTRNGVGSLNAFCFMKGVEQHTVVPMHFMAHGLTRLDPNLCSLYLSMQEDQRRAWGHLLLLPCLCATCS